ncbi:MAG: glutamate dehydrogenase [Deltaproteobacteria bacterium]|nr:glutamate dehydrogenase [Deltaproteobacteria bacterium]
MLDFMKLCEECNPGEVEFLQAVSEVAESVAPVLDKHPEYRKARILERMVEPERVIMFRVPWVDDRGEVQINRGYRIQVNSAIGQGKSDVEVMRFCHSFMSEIFRHIGPNTDVPAGDIGVGGREIGFLFGMYKKLRNEFTGVLTGKALTWGGSLIRPEATGYGAVYFAAEMLATRGETLDGKTCLVSGSGNVAQYTVEKILDLGGKAVTLSDSSGYIYDEEGIDRGKLAFIMELKNFKRGRIKEYADKYPGAVYVPVDPSLDHNPLWSHKADGAFPSATQNEVNAKDAKNLVDNGVQFVSEGANMPTVPEGVETFVDAGILYAPGKAANAGGVSVSGLEMAQNSMRLSWSREEVDDYLKRIMKSIHTASVEAANEYGTPGNYVNGANIAGFTKVAEAMMAQGVV